MLSGARLCSHPLSELLIDGESRPSRQVRLRATLDGASAWSDVVGVMGVEERRFEGLASLEEVLPDFFGWMDEVATRRRAP